MKNTCLIISGGEYCDVPQEVKNGAAYAIACDSGYRHAERMGIRPDRSATYINDSVGISTNYKAVSNAMLRFRTAGCIDAESLESVRADYKARSRK